MNPQKGAGRTGKPLTVRVATWSARHRWPVFGLWFAFTIGLFAASLAMGGTKTIQATQASDTTTESGIAESTFNAAGSGAPHEDFVLVISSSTIAADAPAFQATVASAVAALGNAADSSGTAVFAQLIDPYAAPAAAGLISADGTTVRIVGTLDGDPAALLSRVAPIRPILDEIRAGAPGYEIRSLSNTMMNQDLNEIILGDMDGSLKLTLPLTFIILLVAFGAIVAASVPLILAVTSLLAGFGVLGIYSQLVSPVAATASQLVLLIGLAVAVDYSLFIITRFRTERRLGRDKHAAIEIASGTAGRAVFFSGLAVAISIAGLFTLGVDMLTSMAIGCIGVVVISVIGSLTFLPATLAILGDRVNVGRVPFLARDRDEGTGLWARLVALVVRRPIILGVVAAAALIGMAAPVGHLRMGQTDITSYPAEVDGVAAIKLLNDKWPQGTTLQLHVIVTEADKPATQAAIGELETAVLAAGGASGPAIVTPSTDGTVARVSFVMPGTQNDQSNHQTVNRLRADVLPAVFADLPGVEAYVSGAAAMVYDSTKIFSDGIPMVFGFVLGLSFLLLLIAFRSVVIPATAILLNLLSMGAAYGVLTLVFQDGWFAAAIGVTPGPVIEAFVPLFVFTIIYGLSMDYHLFILTRIKEARDQGLDSRAAVARGISVTAGTITSAAAIMVIVFSVFVTMKFASVQQLGLGLAVAVFIDATIIRTILLPAAMRLLGDWNWYLPGFLGWLPHVTIEVEPEAERGTAPTNVPAPAGQPLGGAAPKGVPAQP
jgi:putative drug exporter of the RND superfamily